MRTEDKTQAGKKDRFKGHEMYSMKEYVSAHTECQNDVKFRIIFPIELFLTGCKF